MLLQFHGSIIYQNKIIDNFSQNPVSLFTSVLRLDTVPDWLSTIRPGDRLSTTIGKINAIAPVVESIDLTARMFKKIFHLVVLVIGSRNLADRLLDRAGGRRQQKKDR